MNKWIALEFYLIGYGFSLKKIEKVISILNKGVMQ